MASSFKTDMQSARAFGAGDWERVVEIETAALQHEEHKQFRYAMIGMAYENMGDLENAIENYGLAISLDERCVQALEGIARAYAKENNHDLAYQYVLKGLHVPTDEGVEVPRFVKYLLAILIKVFRPSRSFSKIYEETKTMDQSRRKWTEWALKYKTWYESQNGPSDHERMH